ncbi:MAG: hypothetical protein ACR2IE_11515 [Candidatus Sumerlaeaceae bacterium]
MLKRGTMAMWLRLGWLAMLVWATPLVHAGGYSVIDVTSGSVISGVVRWDGELPKPFRFEVRSDTLFCTQNRAVQQELIQIDTRSLAVQGALVYLSDIGAGASMANAGVSLEGLLRFDGCTLKPPITLLRERDTLEYLSHDDFVHTPVLDIAGAPVMEDLVSPGMRRRVRVPEAGVYSVRCYRHPWEYSTVFAVEHPYYSMTNAAGVFRIRHVPPGSYTLSLWHPTIDPEPVAKNGVIIDYNFNKPIKFDLKILVRREQELPVEFVLPLVGGRHSQ